MGGGGSSSSVMIRHHYQSSLETELITTVYAWWLLVDELRYTSQLLPLEAGSVKRRIREKKFLTKSLFCQLFKNL